jgi:hypothetical protein
MTYCTSQHHQFASVHPEQIHLDLFILLLFTWIQIITGLSDSLQYLPPGEEFKFAPPNNKTKHKSYVQTVKASTSVPLMHNSVIPPHRGSSSALSALQAKIFKSSRIKDAYLLEISACRDKYTDQQGMIVLKEHNPNVYA